MPFLSFLRWPATLAVTLAVCAGTWICANYISLLLMSQPRALKAPFEHIGGGNHGAVVSENSLCSRIGTDALLEGGSAADALVSAALCVGVVAMYHGGIGVEASCCGVPGELMCLHHIHLQYGRLPWARLFEPAIELARKGFQVNQDLITAMEDETVRGPDFLTKDPAWAVDFAPNGRLVKLGDRMTRPRYAQTLYEISQSGPEVFYKGFLAASTVAAVKAKGGILSLKDFRDYKAVIREPVHITYHDYRIVSTGVPASGAVLLSALKIVEGYKDMKDETSINISTHHMCEAFKFAYGQRTELGDPSFVPETEFLQSQMLNSRVAQEIRAKISDQHTLPLSMYNPKSYQILEDAGTAHMIAVDGEGLAITFTSTMNDYFGSHVIIPETGVILNDQMNDFSIPNVTNAFGYLPSPANFVRPGKRPLSSLSPTIVEHLGNSSFYIATGAAGGSRIITSVAQVLWAMLDRELSSHDALKLPRFHDQLQPNQAEFQWDYDNTTVAFMKSRGHNVTWMEPGSNAYAIKVGADGRFDAAADPHLIAAGVSVV